MRPTVLLLLAVAACAAPPPEYPFVAAGPYGEVRAHDGRVARSVEAHARWLAPQVAELLRVDRVDFTIDVSDESLGDGVLGKTIFAGDGRGHGDTRIELGPDADLYILAHELVHAHAGGVWEALPHVVEEGLADFVASRFDPHCAPVEWFKSSLEEAAERDPLALCVECIAGLDPTRWKDLGEFERSVFYAVGYMLAANVGVGELHGMCAEVPAGAEVDLRALFRRAGIDPGAPGSWAGAIDRR